MMREYEQYCDFGSRSYYTYLERRPDLNTLEFEEFVITHNRADRDSGELQDISMEEVGRLGDLFKKETKSEAVARAIVSLTLDGKYNAAKLLLTTPILKKESRASRVFQIPTEDELREMFSRQKQHGKYLTKEEVEKAVTYRLRWLTNHKIPHKARKAIEEAERTYSKEVAIGKPYKNLLSHVKTNPSRDLTPFYDVYKDAQSQDEIDAIATGQLIPYGWMGPFKPIEIVVSDEIDAPYLEDGNHRLQAARHHGATQVRVKIRWVEEGLTVKDVTAIVPLR